MGQTREESETTMAGLTARARPEARLAARAANLGRGIPAPVRMDGAKPRLYRAAPRPRPGVLTPGLFSTEPRGTG